jgi:RHS repeat-associated protein
MQGAGGVGGLLAVSLNGAWYFPLFDANGNITAYVNEQGVIVAEYTYDAFGGIIAQSGSMADAFRHRFSTKYYDTETGLYYYGYRFYDPAMHRWLNRDPIEEKGGLNLYAFCGNDGVNGWDLLGLEPPGLNEFFTQEKAKYNISKQIEVRVYCNPKRVFRGFKYVSQTDSQVSCHGGSLHIVITPRFGVPSKIRSPIPQRGKKIFGSGYGVIDNLFVPTKDWVTPNDFWGDAEVIGTTSTMSGFKYPIYQFDNAQFNVGRFIDIKYAGTETWVPDPSSGGKMFRTWYAFRNSVDGGQVNAIISPLKCNDVISIQIGCAGEEELIWKQVLKITK